MFRGKVSGFEDIDQMLARLPALVGSEAQSKALVDAAEPVRATAASLCKRGTVGHGRGAHKGQHLADNIEIYDVTQHATSTKATIVVSYPRDFFYGHMLEWGTSPKAARGAQGRTEFMRRSQKTGEMKIGYTRKHKALRGHPGIKARPFLRPAWDAHKGDFLSLFGAAMWQRLSNALPSGWALAKRNTRHENTH